MSVTVSIPTPLRSFTGGRDAVDVSGATVGEVLDGLLAVHTGLKRHLVQDDGRLRNFVNLYRYAYDTPYLNRDDSRMSPKTFEGYTLQGSVGGQDGAPAFDLHIDIR